MFGTKRRLAAIEASLETIGETLLAIQNLLQEQALTTAHATDDMDAHNDSRLGSSGWAVERERNEFRILLSRQLTFDQLVQLLHAVKAEKSREGFLATLLVVALHVSPGRLVAILDSLEENVSELLVHMSATESVSAEIVSRLRDELLAKLEQGVHVGRSAELVASILREMDGSHMERALQSLKEGLTSDPDFLERVQNYLFTFEDLIRVDHVGIQRLLRKVEPDQLTLALKGGSEDLRELIFASMPNAEAEALPDQMDAMGPVRLDVVDQAQIAIMRAARTLDDAGEIKFVWGSGEAELVY